MSRKLQLACLWGGISLCAWLLLRSDAIIVMPAFRPVHLVVALGTLLAIWLCAVESWRSQLRAFGMGIVRWRTAAHQLGLLLVGKYLPGGVWGFIARAQAGRNQGMARAIATGVCEQMTGLLALFTSAVILYSVTYVGALPALAAAFVMPALVASSVHFLLRLLAASGIQATKRMGNRLGSLSAVPTPSISLLLPATLWAALQNVCLFVLVGGSAMGLFGLSFEGATTVVGAYGLAVVVGILAVFAPGGIIVREAAFVALAHGQLSPEQATALGAMIRLLLTSLDMVAGVVALIVRPVPSRWMRD